MMRWLLIYEVVQRRLSPNLIVTDIAALKELLNTYPASRAYGSANEI